MSLHARRPPRGVERRFGGCEVGFSRGASRAFRGARLIGGGAIRSRFQGEERSQASHRAPLWPAPEPHSRAWCEGAFPKAEHRARRSPRRSRGGHAVVTEPSIGDRGGAHRNSGRRERSTPGPSGLVRAASVSVRAPPRDVVRGPLALSFPVTRPRRGSARSSRPARALCGALCGASGESGGRTSPHGPRASRSRRVA